MASSGTQMYALAIHAGAAESWIGDSSTSITTCDFLDQLLRRMATALADGAHAIDVVTEAVTALEDYPEFNAGRGSAINDEGFHELEAAIVDGNTSEYRAAAGLRRTKNPVRLARRMLDEPSLCFLAGGAGDNHTSNYQLDMVDNSHFTTTKRQQFWASRQSPSRNPLEEHGTVGAVAMDIHGHLASANSTGGTMFKAVGRVGDTCVNGAGIYADRKITIACSGSGEPILKSSVAAKAAMHYEYGCPVDVAMEKSLANVASLFPRSSCGVISVDSHGSVSMQCSSRIFAVGSVSASALPSSQIMRCTMPILPQHVTYKNDLLTAGLTKYPTTPGQMMIRLRRGSSIVSLEQQDFVEFFDHVRICAQALPQNLGRKACGFTMSDCKEGMLLPFTDDNFTHDQDTNHSDQAIFESLTAIDQASHQITAELCPTMTTSENPTINAAASQTHISLHIDSSVEIFSLSPTAFHTLIQSMWTTTRAVSHNHSVPLDNIRITINPFCTCNLSSNHPPTGSQPAPTETPAQPSCPPHAPQICITPGHTPDGPRYFPAPAPYTERYPGYITPELGTRVADLTALDDLAVRVRQTTERIMAEGV